MDILLVIYVIVVVCLVGIILIQRSTSDGFTGAGGGNSLFSGRAGGDFLTRTTSLLGAAFLILCLGMAWLVTHQKKESSIVEGLANEPAQEQPSTLTLDKVISGEKTTEDKPAGTSTDEKKPVVPLAE